MKTQGPKVTTHYSCGDCVHVTSKRYAVQGDSGSDVECTEPSIGKRYIGDTTWDTPTWCPLRVDPVVAARVEGEEAGFARGIEAAASLCVTRADRRAEDGEAAFGYLADEIRALAKDPT